MNVYAAFFDIHHAVFNELFFLINRESSPATCFFGVGGRNAVPPVLQAQHTAGSGDYSCSHRLSRLSFRRGATSAQKAKITRRFSISSLDYQRLSICVQQAEPHPSFFYFLKISPLVVVVWQKPMECREDGFKPSSS